MSGSGYHQNVKRTLRRFIDWFRSLSHLARHLRKIKQISVCYSTTLYNVYEFSFLKWFDKDLSLLLFVIIIKRYLYLPAMELALNYEVKSKVPINLSHGCMKLPLTQIQCLSFTCLSWSPNIDLIYMYLHFSQCFFRWIMG